MANVNFDFGIPAGDGVTNEGFSAHITSINNVSANQTITGWSTSAPFFPSPSNSFNATTGTYTVPATGVYFICANINFDTTAAVSASLGGSVAPYFAVSRTSPTATTLLTGVMPVLNVNVALVLTLRAVLGSGSVNFCGEAKLNQGDVIALSYISNGLTLALNLGGSNGSGIFWTVQRIA